MAQIHPALVHFPIALLIAGIVLDLASGLGWVHARGLRSFALWSTTLGVLAMFPAIGSGLLAQAFQPAPTENVQALINLHERINYLILVLFGILLTWRWDARGDDGAPLPPAYLAASLIGLLLLIVGGYFGGRLVYEYGMGFTAPPAP